MGHAGERGGAPGETNEEAMLRMIAGRGSHKGGGHKGKRKGGKGPDGGAHSSSDLPEERRDELRTLLQDFAAGPEPQLALPATTSGLERKFLHELAEGMGLVSQSFGQGRDRCLSIFRSAGPGAATDREEEPVGAAAQGGHEGGGHKGKRKGGKGSGGGAPSSADLPEERREELRALLESFAAGPESQLAMPATISGLERKFLHELAEGLGLTSQSFGQGKDRCLSIFKPAGLGAATDGREEPAGPPEAAKAASEWPTEWPTPEGAREAALGAEGVAYSALVLDEESRERLLDFCGRAFAASGGIPAGWTTYCEHMTICMGPLQRPRTEDNRSCAEAVRRQTAALSVEQEMDLRVVSIGELPDSVLAVGVVGCPSCNKNPHITVAVAPKKRPQLSNDIRRWTVLPAEEQVELHGAVWQRGAGRDHVPPGPAWQRRGRRGGAAAEPRPPEEAGPAAVDAAVDAARGGPAAGARARAGRWEWPQERQHAPRHRGDLEVAVNTLSGGTVAIIKCCSGRSTMFDLKEQVALKIGIPACLQDIQLDGRVTENDEWIATTDGFKLSVTLVVRHGLVEFKVANNTNHRNGFAPKMACYSKLISPEPAPLGTIVKAVIRCGDLIMTTEGQWLPLDILEPLRPNYGEDSDVERDYDVMFLRPDGSTEHKTVEWMSSNGFSEIQVGMGIWSSKWMFQPGFVDTVDREDVKHKVGLAMSGVLGNPDLIP